MISSIFSRYVAIQNLLFKSFFPELWLFFFISVFVHKVFCPSLMCWYDNKFFPSRVCSFSFEIFLSGRIGLNEIEERSFICYWFCCFRLESTNKRRNKLIGKHLTLRVFALTNFRTFFLSCTETHFLVSLFSSVNGKIMTFMIYPMSVSQHSTTMKASPPGCCLSFISCE